MRPKISSNLPAHITGDFVRRMLDQARETVSEINLLAEEDPVHPHTFSVKLTEIIFESKTADIPPTDCWIAWRAMSSLKAVDGYSLRKFDIKGRYTTGGIQPGDEEMAVEALTFEKNLYWVAIFCRHLHKDLALLYAQTLYAP